MDLVELARELAARMAPDALLDREDVAALLKVGPRTLDEAYRPSPGFPRPIHLSTAGGRSQPRWQRQDIIEWIEKHKRRPGRPRKETE
jgi:predicted DNA-binding transcriptional regulator AlpA